MKLGMTRFSTTYLTSTCLYESKASLMIMFHFEDWKTRNFGTLHMERKVVNVVKDSQLWRM